jgi:hypothetical protein
MMRWGMQGEGKIQIQHVTYIGDVQGIHNWSGRDSGKHF